MSVSTRYVFYEKIEDNDLKSQIWDILYEQDDDFASLVSSKSNPYHSNSNNIIIPDLKSAKYFKELLSQYFVVAFSELSGDVVGFLSFKHNYIDNNLKQYQPCNYATTSCIRSSYKDCGIGEGLYNYLDSMLPLEFRLPYIIRRTWSTDYNQVNLFNKLGYSAITTLKDIRGVGIDAVYFGKVV